jgi:hypothetical protein
MAEEDEDRVKGGKEIAKAAAAGLALFAADAQEIKFDTEAATAFKAEHEAAIKAKEAEAEALTGKDNKKARTEKTKEASAMKNDPKYIDAGKVLKGIEAPNGNFMTKVEEGGGAKKKEEAEATAKEQAAKDEAAAKKDDKADKKPAKKQESAGISKAERDELEKIKTDLIKRKSELKAQGMSGGQCNKDEQVVEWVKRMTELKIKEDPSLAGGDGKDKKKDKDAKSNKTEEKIALTQKIEEYKQELVNNFGYTNKEIKADPDMAEMVKALAAMK